MLVAYEKWSNHFNDFAFQLFLFCMLFYIFYWWKIYMCINYRSLVDTLKYVLSSEWTIIKKNINCKCSHKIGMETTLWDQSIWCISHLCFIAMVLRDILERNILWIHDAAFWSMYWPQNIMFGNSVSSEEYLRFVSSKEIFFLSHSSVFHFLNL